MNKSDIKRGNEHYKANSKKYYETHAVVKQSFKRTCKRMNWNYDNFESVFVKYKITPSLQKVVLYYFFEKVKKED